jgi:CubicO group peptidase (beta-lactamase class C family)
MKKITLSLCFLILSSCLNAQVLTRVPVTDRLSADHKAKLKQIIQIQAQLQQLPSLVVAATLDNRVIWMEAVGHADLEKKIPADTTTHLYRWASVSKLLTRLMIETHEAQGNLDTRKSITEYLPELNNPVVIRRCFTAQQLQSLRTCRTNHGEAPITPYQLDRLTTCFTINSLKQDSNDRDNSVRIVDNSRRSGEIIFTQNEGIESCSVSYIQTQVRLNNNRPLTLQQLLRHRGGIGHYTSSQGHRMDPASSDLSDKTAVRRRYVNKESQMEWALKAFYPTLPLHEQPGASAVYSTHGYNLAGVVLEKALGKRMEALVYDYFDKFGAPSLQADYLAIPPRNPRLQSRAQVYRRNNNSRLQANPYTEDNSYKLAGGGFMSTIRDMAVFCATLSKEGYLLPSTRDQQGHTGSHPGRAATFLKYEKNQAGQPQCLVLMTNTNHDSVDLTLIEERLRRRLIGLGIWQN